MAQAETVREVDLRQEIAQEPHAYYIVLCARKSEGWGTGHSFVVWAETDREGQVLNLVPQGFYPKMNQALVHVFGGRGTVVDESTHAASMKQHLLTHRLVCRVDHATYVRSWNANRRWHGARHDYHLLTRNCTHYTHEIASSIGLAPPYPERGERPPVYLNRVMQTARGTRRTPDAHRAQR